MPSSLPSRWIGARANECRSRTTCASRSSARQLRVYYQPRVECRSGRLLGAEALVRWQHPQHGLMTPARFIPVAEDSGLIIPLGTWVLAEACGQQARWRASGADLAISVNLSAEQLRDPDLLAHPAATRSPATISARR
jgi:EAL domain-containing protein (putative c-di-GMP-specific phosphodiesterase class I)